MGVVVGQMAGKEMTFKMSQVGKDPAMSHAGLKTSQNDC